MPGDFQSHVKEGIQVYVKQQQGVWFNNAPSPQSSEGVVLSIQTRVPGRCHQHLGKRWKILSLPSEVQAALLEGSILCTGTESGEGGFVNFFSR